MLNKKIADIEKYVRELEKDGEELRVKKTRNEMAYLINQSDATLIMDIVIDLKEILGVE